MTKTGPKTAKKCLTPVLGSPDQFFLVWDKLLRYEMSELQKMGRGAEMQAAEAAERNWSVSLHRVKTWPQLMCCALV